MNGFRLFTPTDTYVKEGMLGQNAPFSLDYEHALIVTSKNISNARYGALETLRTMLEKEGVKVSVFDEVTRPLHAKTVLKAAYYANENDVDLIVGHGSAKAIDAAKVVGRMVRENPEFLDAWLSSKYRPPFENDPVDVISVPTTLTLTASLNHKIYLYNPKGNRYERLKDSSFTPKAAIIDPTLFTTLDEETLYGSVSDTTIKLFDLLGQNISPFHTDLAQAALKRLIRSAEGLENDIHDQETLSNLAHANVLLSSMFVKKPYFPLHMLNDAILGFHPELFYSRFLKKASLHYIDHRLPQISEERIKVMQETFKGSAYEQETLKESFVALFSPFIRQSELITLKEKHYPEDYLIHLKTLYPAFSALKDSVVYAIIDQTIR
ncbi:MAG: iron-containing alcohol dehydrogenase [Bacillota bacterium]